MNRSLILGADVGGTYVKYVLGDGDEPGRWTGEVPSDPASPATTFGRLAARVAELLPPAAGIGAAGLACAGIVDVRTGRLGRTPNLPGWEGADLAGLMGIAFPGAAIALANDVNAALAGEARFGAGRNGSDLVMLALGTGVGGAVMIEGRLLAGHRFGAGEIGHTILDVAGPPCNCGNRGCLEAYAGSRGLLAAARRRAAAPDCSPGLRALVAERGDLLTTRDLADLATVSDLAAADRDAAALFREAGERLGQAVGNLLNVLDPDRVIIGGGVAAAGELLLGPCREAAARIVLCEAARSTPIVPAQLGSAAAAFGAAHLAAIHLAAAAPRERS
ncbi:MAG: glucokinase [Gemmatimonas sp.]|nr:glucokinase [Gemmatimonas sp.]